MVPSSRRRGHGEVSVYSDASKNRWVGATSLGISPGGERRIRQKVRGRSKAKVRGKLQALHRELDAGAHTSATCTVGACIQDWLANGLTGKQPSAVDDYTRLAGPGMAWRPLGWPAGGNNKVHIRAGEGAPA